MRSVQVRGFQGPQGPLDLEIGHEVVRVMGPNGSGKTSLLRCIAGLPQPFGGTVDVQGSIGYVPQDARDAMIGLVVAGEFRFRDQSGDVPGLMDRDVATLSSGQARRVAIELARDADVLLLDEASEGLDEERIEALRSLIEGHDGPVLLADHDPRLADLATMTIDLGATMDAGTFQVEDAAGPAILSAPEFVVERASGLLPLPSVSFGSGLHAVAGPNGCGKSTLLLRLAGLLQPEGVHVQGEASRPGDNVRLLLPHARDHLMEATVRDSLWQADADIVQALVPTTLMDRHPARLSGGEAQRVALAKVLGQSAPVYLLDEPEAHLDQDGRAALAHVLSGRIRDGACIVVATHDEDILHACQEVLRWH